MSINLNNINNILPSDCMVNLFVLSEESPAVLTRVCKTWHRILEESYPSIAALYRRDSRILPFMPLISEIPIDGNDVQFKCKLIVQQTYRRIVKGFLNAPHIEKTILELGLKTTPFTPLGQTLSVAEDSNLVESFQSVFRRLDNRFMHSKQFQITFEESLISSCKAISNRLDMTSFGIRDYPSDNNKDKASCIRHWITHNPEILNKKDMKIDIVDKQITGLPLEVLSFAHITSLDLSDNRLDNLPDVIVTLSELTFLGLANNRFTFIPETIFKLGNLENLYFKFNEISHLPKSICDLSKLEYLNLEGNKLTSLPEECFQLNNLISIDIKKNNINTSGLRSIADKLQQLPMFEIKEFKETHGVKDGEPEVLKNESLCSIQ